MMTDEEIRIKLANKTLTFGDLRTILDQQQPMLLIADYRPAGRLAIYVWLCANDGTHIETAWRLNEQTLEMERIYIAQYLCGGTIA